jgi:hypothetical protein
VDRGRQRHPRGGSLRRIAAARTPEIDAFLTLEPDDKVLVFGTKGFRATLHPQ